MVGCTMVHWKRHNTMYCIVRRTCQNLVMTSPNSKIQNSWGATRHRPLVRGKNARNCFEQMQRKKEKKNPNKRQSRVARKRQPCKMKRKTSQQVDSRAKKVMLSRNAGITCTSEQKEEIIESTLVEILLQRGPEKTCWPSEVPRKVYDWQKLDTERKKELMLLTRGIAYRKAKEGFLHVLQRGRLVENPSESTVKGIIRLRLAIPSITSSKKIQK